MLKFAIGTLVALGNTSNVRAQWDGWADSKVADAWHQATGMEFDPSSEILVIDGNIVRAEMQDGKVLQESIWICTASAMIGSQTHDALNDNGKNLCLRQVVTLDAGFTTAMDGSRVHFISVVLHQWATTIASDGSTISGDAVTMIPLRCINDSREGNDFIESLNFKGDVQIDCHDPNWVGSNGEQCCGYVMALSHELGSCLSRYWNHVYLCIPAALGAGGTSFTWCAKQCIMPPPFGPSCIKFCILGAAGITLGSFWSCIGAADHVYNECTSDAYARYYRSLADHGCRIKNPDQLQITE